MVWKVSSARCTVYHFRPPSVSTWQLTLEVCFTHCVTPRVRIRQFGTDHCRCGSEPVVSNKCRSSDTSYKSDDNRCQPELGTLRQTVWHTDIPIHTHAQICDGRGNWISRIFSTWEYGVLERQWMRMWMYCLCHEKFWSIVNWDEAKSSRSKR